LMIMTRARVRPVSSTGESVVGRTFTYAFHFNGQGAFDGQ